MKITDDPGRESAPIREQLADARYAVRAWAQGVAWLTVLAGLGMIITGYARRDSGTFASGTALVVSAFLPRIKPTFAYQVALTLAYRWGWGAAPTDETPEVRS